VAEEMFLWDGQATLSYRALMYTYHTMLFLLLRFGCLAHTAVIGVLELSSPPLVAAERIELPLHGSKPCALPFGYAAV
jgi:hypothetical protein